MKPQKAYISKEGENGASTPGVIVADPHVGDPMQLFFEDGKVMRTSRVKRVERNGPELVVDTENSRYRLILAAA